jgi:low affinity Fe/Cu permease
MTFDRLARCVTDWAGSWQSVTIAFALVFVWAVLGPVFGFSNAWQLVINTATTVITYLMVFIIQHASNRDTASLHAKLDELLRAIPQARDDLRGIERDEEGGHGMDR